MHKPNKHSLILNERNKRDYANTTLATTIDTSSALNSLIGPHQLNSSFGSIDLEDYISAMEARTNNNNNSANAETDVWAQLQQKESDILLAAELGKALLEKNEELQKQQEKLIEDYSGKIEVSASFVNYYAYLLRNRNFQTINKLDK